jgi:hypothetical protein
MSKRKLRKKFRKKSERAEVILRKLAVVLDEAQSNKVQIKLSHGIVVSRYGYVLPVGRKWAVRTLIDLGYEGDDDED